MPRLWDNSLYSGSAEYYLRGRLPYPTRLREAFQGWLGLDGSGRLLDLGCGPGSLTLLLATLFAEVVGVDADPDMLTVAQLEAEQRAIKNVRWRHAYVEDLQEPGSFEVVTLAQSFHWMDRPAVAEKIHGWLAPEGCCVHVDATTQQGTGAAGLPHPAPPRDEIAELIRAYLGPERRAGQQVVPGGQTPGDEASVFRGAGFRGPTIVPVPGGDVFERSEDQVLASVLSRSSAAPHLFGDQLAAFVADVRRVLRAASPSGLFCEQLSGMRLLLWRR